MDVRQARIFRGGARHGSIDDMRQDNPAAKTDALDKLAPDIQFHGLRRYEQADVIADLSKLLPKFLVISNIPCAGIVRTAGGWLGRSRRRQAGSHRRGVPDGLTKASCRSIPKRINSS